MRSDPVVEMVEAGRTYRRGDEWFVVHTLMRPRDAAAGN